jgi:hypothetical protein
MNFNFDLEPEDYQLLLAIVRRLKSTKNFKLEDFWGDETDFKMDLTVTHNHAVKLDFGKLLDAPDSVFFHDIMGIRRGLNRETGKLDNLFLPKCTLKSE